MKTADDKLRYKNHFFKLGQGRVIAGNDSDYWKVLWTEPDNSDDIFELLTSYDIRTIRDQNRVNYLVMIHVLCNQIIATARDSEFPSSKSPLSIRQLLTCIRLLVKLIPFLYEIPEYTQEIEPRLFWVENFDPLVFIKPSTFASLSSSTSQPCLTKESIHNVTAVQLMRALVDLLFIRTFTIDAPRSKSNKILSVWEPGIGTSSKYLAPNLIIDSNRAEVLKLLLTLCSSTFYNTPSEVVSAGSKFMTLLVTSTPRVELLTLVCSLTNLVCRSTRSSPEDNALSYPSNSQLTEMRHLTVTYSIQLLTAMVVYPLPSPEKLDFLKETELISTSKPGNLARLYMGKLHKDQELVFLSTYLIAILKLPVVTSKDVESSKFNIIKSGNQPSLWATEATMLIWELIQCNKKFKTLIYEQSLPELLVVLFYYIFAFHSNVQHKNLVRICAYLMLYCSSDKNLDSIFEPMDHNLYESLPTNYKTNPAPTTTRDFLVTQICNLLIYMQTPQSTYTYGATLTPSPLMVTTLVEILYNLIPPVATKSLEATNDPAKKLTNSNPNGGLSYSTCSVINLLIGKYSSRTFLQEKSINSDLLALLIRAVCTAALKYPKSSRMLLFSILKNAKVYDQVWNTIYSFRTEYFNGNKLNRIDDGEEGSANEETEEENENILSVVNSNNSERFKPESETTDSESPQTRKNSMFGIGTPPMTIPEESQQSDAEEELEASLRPKLPTGMSERAREKLPKESSLKRSWGGNDSLRILLTIVIPYLKVVLKEIWSSKDGPTVDSYLLVEHIEKADFDDLLERSKTQINYDFLPDKPLDKLKFNWSHLSLGWYISLLGGAVYNSVDSVKTYTGNNNKIMKNITTSIASVSKLTSSWTGFMKHSTTAYSANDSAEVAEWVKSSLTAVNQWNHTDVKLFKIETSSGSFFGKLGSVNEAVPGTPGGVNDMANSIVRRLSDFRLNNSSRGSISSVHSGLTTPVEEQEQYFPKFSARNSITSLHSLNAINRSRSATPRNSMSN
ncbi:hypothetical protein G9P44_004417 [Scheffersomyces stipitis]|nr:hypothetical protein G9P44_004417 [Scheffersomyces stipitis]